MKRFLFKCNFLKRGNPHERTIHVYILSLFRERDMPKSVKVLRESMLYKLQFSIMAHCAPERALMARTLKIRTIDKAYEEFKAKDPDTDISRNLIRQLVVSGAVPSTRAGNKYLVDIDVLEEHIRGLIR